MSVRVGLEKKERIKFGIFLVFIFGITIAYNFWKGNELLFKATLIIAILNLILVLINYKLLDIIYYKWIKLGDLMSVITTPIIMGCIYFVVITPIALLLRAFRIFRSNDKAHSDSLWSNRKKEKSISDLRKLY